jgi:ADP-ribose pyrophosphatase YjhB (NUDIX family)
METKKVEIDLSHTEDPIGFADQYAMTMRKESGTKLGAFTVIVKGDSIALVQLSYGKENYGGYIWSLPGGGIDANEAPSAGAIRETYEETGIKLANDDLQLVALLNRPYVQNEKHPEAGELTLLFACNVGDECEMRSDSPEIREANFFEFNLDEWLSIPSTGSGDQKLQPLRRHWIYWSQIGFEKVRDPQISPVVWEYPSGDSMSNPIRVI